MQSRVKALDKIEKIELPKKRKIVKFDFRTPPRSGDQVAELLGVTKAYGKRVVHDHLVAAALVHHAQLAAFSSSAAATAGSAMASA